MNLQEMYGLMHNETFLIRVTMAVLVACDKIRLEPQNTPSHAQRLAWAKATLINPRAAGEAMTRALVVSYRAKSVAEATEVLDDVLQEEVEGLINQFV